MGLAALRIVADGACGVLDDESHGIARRPAALVDELLNDALDVRGCVHVRGAAGPGFRIGPGHLRGGARSAGHVLVCGRERRRIERVLTGDLESEAGAAAIAHVGESQLGAQDTGKGRNLDCAESQADRLLAAVVADAEAVAADQHGAIGGVLLCVVCAARDPVLQIGAADGGGLGDLVDVEHRAGEIHQAGSGVPRCLELCHILEAVVVTGHDDPHLLGVVGALVDLDVDIEIGGVGAALDDVHVLVDVAHRKQDRAARIREAHQTHVDVGGAIEDLLDGHLHVVQAVHAGAGDRGAHAARGIQNEQHVGPDAFAQGRTAEIDLGVVGDTGLRQTARKSGCQADDGGEYEAD